MCSIASLARALVGHPKVLLLGEPLGALDVITVTNPVATTVEKEYDLDVIINTTYFLIKIQL